jgi:phosphoglycolate phosphatase
MLLVGFDIDGTLLRVRPQPVRTALRAALQETLGTEVPPEALTDLAGKTDLQILREVAHRLARRVLLRKLAREFIRRYEERYFRLVQPEDVQLLPGVERALECLARQGLPLGILTGNLEAIARWKLRSARIAQFFGLGAYGSEHWQRAHLVRLLQERARRQGIDRIVLVGDSLRDVSSARRCGVHCIAVATGVYSSEELRAAGAYRVLPTLEAVEPLLETLHELGAQAHHCD